MMVVITQNMQLRNDPIKKTAKKKKVLFEEKMKNVLMSHHILLKII